jgi:hypothetical protein
MIVGYTPHVMKQLYSAIVMILLVLVSGCEERPLPAPPATPTIPVPESVRVGVATGAQQFALIGLNDAATYALSYTLADGKALRDDVTNGMLDAAFVYVVPDGAFWFNPVVVDGIVLIVNLENPVEKLTLVEARQIYSGELTNWSAVGGQNLPIDLIVPGRETDVRTIFNERVMGAQRVSINAEVSPNPDALIKRVIDNRNAIGVTTVGTLSQPEQVRRLQIEQTEPNPNQLAQQIYPLAMPIYWISLAEPQGAARDVLAKVQSPPLQEALGSVFGRIR